MTDLTPGNQVQWIDVGSGEEGGGGDAVRAERVTADPECGSGGPDASSQTRQSNSQTSSRIGEPAAGGRPHLQSREKGMIMLPNMFPCLILCLLCRSSVPNHCDDLLQIIFFLRRDCVKRVWERAGEWVKSSLNHFSAEHFSRPSSGPLFAPSSR